MKLRRSASRRATAVVGLAAALVSASALTASAITGGQPDGKGHPNVGMIGFYDGTGRYRCSATLVSPTVVLTAAHCTDGTLGKTALRFDSVIALTSPSPLPVAADTAAGYTSAELKAAGWLSGTAHTHPEYSDFTDVRNWNDVGVVVLDEPVEGIAPASIAPENYLDKFVPKVLNKTLFTAVGYGTEVRQPDGGPQKPVPESYPIIRRVAELPGQKLTPSCSRSTATRRTHGAREARASVTPEARRSRVATWSR